MNKTETFTKHKGIIEETEEIVKESSVFGLTFWVGKS